MLDKFFQYNLIESGDFALSINQLIGLIFILLCAYVAWRLTKAKWRIDFFNTHEVIYAERRRFEKYMRQMVLLLASLSIIRLLNLDFELTTLGGGIEDVVDNEGSQFILRYSFFFYVLIVLVSAWMIEWFFSNILISKYEKDRKGENLSNDKSAEKVRSTITRLVQYIVIILAFIAIIKNFGWDFKIFQYKINDETRIFRPSQILVVVFIFMLAQIVSWVLTQVILYGIYKRKSVDQGARFAINQLLKYVIYFVAVIFSLNSLGINMTLIWGGAAALLVGIGLGLQQTFNDFFSGLVLLFERSVSVGDVMDIGGDVGSVRKIGMRSSIIETRSNISLIVPNSKLVNESVKNWTHFVDFGRFDVSVGVAYGSDTKLVKELLMQVVEENKQVLDYPTPFVRFNNFGDSALEFSVFFFSNRFIVIEDIKSDIRFEIDKIFRENNIAIPFPQRDIWLRNSD